MWKLIQKVSTSPDTEEAPRADAEMKHPQTQGIMRDMNMKTEQMHLLLLPCVLQRISRSYKR